MMLRMFSPSFHWGDERAYGGSTNYREKRPRRLTTGNLGCFPAATFPGESFIGKPRAQRRERCGERAVRWTAGEIAYHAPVRPVRLAYQVLYVAATIGFALCGLGLLVLAGTHLVNGAWPGGQVTVS